MIKNENGSALVLVLLMSVVLTVLALAVLGSTLNDAKQTSFREQDIITIHEAQTAIEEAVALIKATFQYGAGSATLDEHNTNITNFLKLFDPDDISSINENFTIKAGTSFSDTQFSRDFIITTEAQDDNGRIVEFKQTVYLSAIPSFLYYAVGSAADCKPPYSGCESNGNYGLTFNGSPTIKGNIYVRNSLFINKSAQYTYNEDDKTILSSLPYLNGEIVIEDSRKRLFIDDVQYYLNNNSLIPFNSDPEKQLVTIGDVEFFNDVDLNKTIVDNYNNIATPKVTNMNSIEGNDISYSNSKFFLVPTEDNLLVSKNSLIVESNCTADCSPVIEGDLILTSDINIPEGQLLLVKGNLWIYSTDSSGIEIDGNILVTKDLKIIGNNIKFDSAVFVLGNTEIHNASILPLEKTFNGQQFNSPLVLFSVGNLIVSRVNEFEDVDTEKQINAFLYTASDATLYGVGSRVNISGGIFSEGNLTINAVRGKVENNVSESLLEFPSIQVSQENLSEVTSRFYVNHSPEILTPAYSFSKSYNGLPRTTNFNIILDRREFNRK